MGRHQMPGDVWWRSWRTPPPQQCPTDPVNANTGSGHWHTYTDPRSGKQFQVWEGHYTYPGTSLTFVPTFGAIGHRRLVLDQSMIMAALDDVLNGDASHERMSIH